MATDKPAPTPEEVEALITELERHAEGHHWTKRLDLVCLEAATMLRRLAATVPQAGAVPREPTGEMVQRGVEEKLTVQVGDKSANSIVTAIWRAMYDAAPQAAPERAPSGDAELCEKLRAFPLFYLNGAEWLYTDKPDPICTEAAARIEAMNAQVEEQQRYIDVDWRGQLADAREEIARLKPDAERYGWLRSQDHVDIASCWFLPADNSTPENPKQLDGLIDAALAAMETKP